MLVMVATMLWYSGFASGVGSDSSLFCKAASVVRSRELPPDPLHTAMLIEWSLRLELHRRDTSISGTKPTAVRESVLLGEDEYGTLLYLILSINGCTHDVAKQLNEVGLA